MLEQLAAKLGKGLFTAAQQQAMPLQMLSTRELTRCVKTWRKTKEVSRDHI